MAKEFLSSTFFLIEVIGVDFTENCGELRYGIIFNVTKIILCGTKYLGFRHYSCSECDHGKSVAFSCKGRFCSRCGKKQTDQWITKATDILPKTRWQHITFTMPDSLWPIFWFNRNLFGLISAIAAGIIKEIATKKKLVVGIFTALHTFGRDLKRNVHIHLSVTCGGIDSKGNWRKLFFPAEPIKKMWKHRILELFRSEYALSNLKLPSEYQNDADFNNWMSGLYEISWYVYLQKPSDDHKRNINYLGRYIKRPPISEARIEEYDGKQVTFKFLDHYSNTIDRVTMPVLRFIASLVMHIPDRYFRMIRYYGFLSNRTRGLLLPIVYKAINQIAPKKIKVVSWRLMIWLNFKKDPLSCPNCNQCMGLRQVYYGLSPPLLLVKINELLLASR